MLSFMQDLNSIIASYCSAECYPQVPDNSTCTSVREQMHSFRDNVILKGTAMAS